MSSILNTLTLGEYSAGMKETDLASQQKLRLFKLITFFAVVVFAGVAYQAKIAIPGPSISLILIGVLFVILCANYFLLPYHKNTNTTYIILVATLYSLLHLLSYSQGGIRNAGLFYLAAIILMSYILMGRKSGVIVGLIGVVHVIYFYLISTYTTWTDYSLIGTDPALIDLDFLISGVLSILVLTSQANYIEKSKNAVIDEIKERKNELTEKNRALENSQAALNTKNRAYEQKNKELEEFVYTASHDLREPIRTSLNFAELHQKQYKGKLDATADSYIEQIIDASRRMTSLINGLVNYSLIGSTGEKTNVDCNKVVAEITEELKAGLKESGAKLNISALPVVHANEAGMSQVFYNMVENSIKFRRKDVPLAITIQANFKNGTHEFSIADNGIGIDRADFERIFVVFQRLHTRQQYEGTGIGLPNCKKIIELHGGKIRVESEPGKGSTFYFTIPDSTK